MARARKPRRQPESTMRPVSFRYPHDMECWIRATHHASRGVMLLLHALEAQQLPNADRQHRRAEKAETAFAEARRWTRISLCWHEDPHTTKPERADGR